MVTPDSHPAAAGRPASSASARERSASPRHPHPAPRPHLGARVASALTGTTSGSATPSTSYGSFPPGTDRPAGAEAEAKEVQAVEALLRDKLTTPAGGRGSKHRHKLDTSKDANHHRRRWTRSRERLLVRDPHGRVSDDVYDSDAAASGSDSSDPEAEDPAATPPDVVERDFYAHEAGAHLDPVRPWRSSSINGKGRPAGARPADLSARRPSTATSTRRPQGSNSHDGGHGDDDKQWGVVKMELMAKTWGRKGFLTVYAGSVQFPPCGWRPREPKL